MALMELKLVSSQNGVETINTFNFNATGTPAAVTLSFALISAFGAVPDAGVYPASTLLQAIRGIQTGAIGYQLVEARDVYSFVDFYSTPFNPNLAGAVTGDAETPANAIGFRSSRVRTDIRRGQKRFGAVPKSMVGMNGNLTNTTPISALATKLGTALSYDDEGNTLTFTPVVVSKEKYEVERDGVPTGRFAYKYYDTLALQDDHIATGISWDFYSTVRTQTSRQYGRGN